jgi:FKBP-type peptidyl-prolyl cis-trans isomerase FkpA
MDQKELKTSWKTRIVVGIIAFLMLFSTVAVYALIVLSNENKKKPRAESSEELAKVEEELGVKKKELEDISVELSNKYYKTFSNYRSRVKSYNAASVDNAGLKTEDLKKGDGAEITAESTYYSYYIGFCPNEEVFDSSFDDYKNPKELIAPLEYKYGESSFVAGWEEGVIGMKIGGVREISVPAELAYGDTREICGGTNTPLKFIVYAIEPGESFKSKLDEYNKLVEQYYILYYSQGQDLLE